MIVFCEYRESVMEVYALLLQQKPLIKPKVFIGQGAITQRQQLNVITINLMFFKMNFNEKLFVGDSVFRSG